MPAFITQRLCIRAQNECRRETEAVRPRRVIRGNGSAWVLPSKASYTDLVSGVTYSVTDESYPHAGNPKWSKK